MSRVLLVPDLPLERWPSMDRYALRLWHHLRAADPPDLEFALAGPVNQLTMDTGRTDFTAPRVVSEPRRYLERYWLYPRRVRAQRADILHVLDHTYAHVRPGRPGTPRVVTAHDLLPALLVQRRAGNLRHRVRNALLRHALDGLRAADAWIVSTHWMRDELARWLGREGAIHVIPYGVDEAFFTTPPRPPARTDLPSDAFVVLHVGSVTERKNIAGVLTALHELRRRGVNAWLLQVGGEFTPAHRHQLAALGLTDVVRQRPQASEDDLRLCYRLADALLLPSHYEGFGLPVLEAMASGLPVVVSSAPALTEVGGDAAIVVDSRDPLPFADALQGLAEDGRFRETLAAAGRARAGHFTWGQTAEATIGVYRRLA